MDWAPNSPSACVILSSGHCKQSVLNSGLQSASYIGAQEKADFSLAHTFCASAPVGFSVITAADIAANEHNAKTSLRRNILYPPIWTQLNAPNRCGFCFRLQTI